MIGRTLNFTKIHCLLHPSKAGTRWFEEGSSTCCQDPSKTMDTGGDLSQSIWAVVHSIHAGNVGKEGLGCADVGGGLVSPDVLLPGLHCHSQGRPAICITTHTCNHVLIAEHEFLSPTLRDARITYVTPLHCMPRKTAIVKPISGNGVFLSGSTDTDWKLNADRELPQRRQLDYTTEQDPKVTS